MNMSSLKRVWQIVTILELLNIHLLIVRFAVAQSIKSVSDVVVYPFNNKVLNLLKDPTACTFMRCDSSLESQEASIEDIMEKFLQNSDADIIVLMHSLCPFIKQKRSLNV